MSLEVLSETEALLDGRYVLSDRLGRGGMATVYRAEDTRLERTVAVKMLHDGEGSTAFANRAHNEKALLAAVNHPSIVTLFDAQLLPDRPRYLVMEYVDGPTLARRLRTGPMRSRQVARLARDLGAGLADVHALGIVHRDVKPSNVLLGRDPYGGPRTAKLADFGIACQIGSPRMTSPGIVLGTFTYMAPETLRDAEPDTPVDVFALGLVLLEALTGEATYPATATGRGAAAARIMNPPTIPDDLDDAWRDLLGAMTRLDPAERPTAAEVTHTAGLLMKADAETRPIADAPRRPASALAAGAADSAETSETTPIAAEQHTPGRKRRRAVAGIAAASALVATGSLVLGLSVASPPSSVGPRAATTSLERTVVAPDAVDEAPADTSIEVAVTEQTPQQPAVDDAGRDDRVAPGNEGDPKKTDPGNDGEPGAGKPGNGDAGNGNDGKGNPEKGAVGPGDKGEGNGDGRG